MASLQDTKIRPLTFRDSSYFTEATELLNSSQGIGLFAPDYLGQRINDPQSVVFGAFDGGKFIGLGVAEIIQDFKFYLPFDSKLESELKGKIVGSFSTSCVIEKMRGQGVGQKISLERMQWLSGRKAQTILGVSWVSGMANTSDRVFEKMGFRKIKQVEKFFALGDSKNFDCPSCKKIPCACAGILYRWDA